MVDEVRKADVLEILGPHAETYWGKRILAAVERGHFDYDDATAGMGWTTCACGKQDPRLHDEAGTPKDAVLTRLGIDFTGAVVPDRDDFEEAARVLVAIEQRAACLLRNMPKEVA